MAREVKKCGSESAPGTRNNSLGLVIWNGTRGKIVWEQTAPGTRNNSLGLVYLNVTRGKIVWEQTAPGTRNNSLRACENESWN